MPWRKNSTSLLATMPFHIFIEDCASPWEHSPLTPTASTSSIEFALFESEDVSGRAEEEGRFKEARGPFPAKRPVSDFSRMFRATIRERIAANDFGSREDFAKRARALALAEEATKTTKSKL